MTGLKSTIIVQLRFGCSFFELLQTRIFSGFVFFRKSLKQFFCVKKVYFYKKFVYNRYT